jgi:hypothetical protein
VYFEARVRAESEDWTFGAHQAAARAQAAEQLVALRRQYRDLSEADLAELAASWRRDDVSGPYFTFAAAPLGGEDEAAVDAAFLRALVYELGAQTADGLAGLFAQWDDQRRYARRSGLRDVPVHPPRVATALPRDPHRWPQAAWIALLDLDLDDPGFDGTLLTWDASGTWLVLPPL